MYSSWKIELRFDSCPKVLHWSWLGILIVVGYSMRGTEYLPPIQLGLTADIFVWRWNNWQFIVATGSIELFRLKYSTQVDLAATGWSKSRNRRVFHLLPGNDWFDLPVCLLSAIEMNSNSIKCVEPLIEWMHLEFIPIYRGHWRSEEKGQRC